MPQLQSFVLECRINEYKLVYMYLYVFLYDNTERYITLYTITFRTWKLHQNRKYIHRVYDRSCDLKVNRSFEDVPCAVLSNILLLSRLSVFSCYDIVIFFVHTVWPIQSISIVLSYLVFQQFLHFDLVLII